MPKTANEHDGVASSDRLEIAKTHKLYIAGKFPRTESGRTIEVCAGNGRVIAHVCRASRKDLRTAVEAARGALPAWSRSTPLLRGQILYRIAEMMEGKRLELRDAIEAQRTSRDTQRTSSSKKASPAARKKADKKSSKKATSRPAAGRTAASAPHAALDEVHAAIDRVVHYAGWADKYAQVLGCNNPVSGPYYNFTIPEPTGVVALVASDDAPLLSLVSLLAPALCAGNATIALGAHTGHLAASILAEACATGDVPAGVVNILTGQRDELVPEIASHRDIDAALIANPSRDDEAALREGTADNMKRVIVCRASDWFDADFDGPWRIEPLVELKTIWHPSGV
ncbi:MAG: aldehyde dehydrogenase family protein [Phycisphaerales bacterium]|jgi:acyl-CoA reductase-like NAD-dependent aldehyde dehydrogenase|nr:aldehyde dehydrogenase family protein [Phycisphaerales bacterium]